MNNKLAGVEKLLKLYEMELDHARQVNRLSLILFDKTAKLLHNFGAQEREYLNAGSLLHDIGYFIEAQNHNKHSYDLIMKNGIPGYTQQEILIIANIARYHRGKKPKDIHKCYNSLIDSKTKNLVRKLSAICRLADGLDRAHICIVKDIDCVYDEFSQVLHLIIETTMPSSLMQVFAAKKKKTMFEKEFNLSVILRLK